MLGKMQVCVFEKKGTCFPSTTCSFQTQHAAYVFVGHGKLYSNLKNLHMNQPAQTWVLQSKGVFFFSNTVIGISIVKLV